MRLTVDIVNGQVDHLAAKLNGGTLVFYTGSRPESITDALELQLELVRLALPSPAFRKASDGEAISHPIAATPIVVTGDARWARLLTAAGVIVADLLARTQNEPDAGQADAIVDRTDFHRGGLCRVAPIVLKLPVSS